MRIACAAKNCKYSSDDEDSSHIIFINFPNDDTSKIWAHHCGRPDLLVKSNEELHFNYYVCSDHIEDRYYINKTDPIIIEENAVPTLFGSDICTQKETTDIFDVEAQTNIHNVVLSYCDMQLEIDQYQDINLRFPNLCRICGEESQDNIEIFSAKGRELKLKDKVNLHTPIVIDIDDLLPHKVCTNCCNKLDIVHAFAVMSLRTDMRLKRFLNIHTTQKYDNKYNSIVEECSLEVADEINEAVECNALGVSADKCAEITVEHEFETTLNCAENKELEKDAYPTTIEKEIEYKSFIISYNESDNGKDEDIIANGTAEQINSNTYAANKMICIQQNNSYKTSDTFQDGDIHFNSKNVDTNDEIANSDEDFNNQTLLYGKSSDQKPTEFPGKLIAANKNPIIYEELQDVNFVTMLQSKKCGHCETIYSTKKDLLNHITECHGGQMLFKCTACNKTFEKWSSLDVHEATHRIDKPYLCDLCGKRFKHSNNLRGHKRTHLDESMKKRHVCEICGNAFRSRFHLREHMNQHEDNRPYSCDECEKAFHKRIQLRQHKLSHGLNTHVCPVCGVTFNRRGNMNTHLKRHTKGDGTYSCSVCAFRCKSMSELKLHRKKHTNQDVIESIKKKCINKTISQCNICDRVFSKPSVLLNHERLHRGEKISVECDICGKELASKSSLIYHKKSIHSTKRPHMCHYCGESFVSKEARLIHERIHTGERPYVCKICNMRYKCSSNLNQHMKIHMDIRPHKCAYCSKTFIRKGALNVHERIHTGIKPFSCPTCDKSFSQKNDMLKHAKTHNVKSMENKQNNAVIQEYVEVQQIKSSTVTCPQTE